MKIKALTAALLLSTFACQVQAENVVRKYEYSSENFANPERGLFHHVDFLASGSNTLPVSTLRRYRNDENITMVYCGYVLDSFRDGSDISSYFIRRIKANMQRLRQEGLKAVVRFYYSADSQNKPHDVDLDITLRHIEQLAPILQENADVIALLEAGMVGTWGEWWETDCHTFNPQTTADYANRKAIVEAWAEALPDTRMIALRTPMYKMGVLDITAADTITADEAHNGSLKSRLGFHNDCFLANADDAGTYQGSKANRRYLRSDSRYTVVGGETCSDANTYTEMSNARFELSEGHWSYLNADYHSGTLNSWRNNGFMDEVITKLGYRFTLLETTMPRQTGASEMIAVNIKLDNVGWAAPYNPRDVELVVVSPEQTDVYRLDVDPRKWLPGHTITIDAEIPCPELTESSEVKLYLNLPDPAESLHTMPEFSIRLANEDVWDGDLGMNLLGTIRVEATNGVQDASTPEHDAEIYDLYGRRIGKVSEDITLSRGIYIIAGKAYRF